MEIDQVWNEIRKLKGRVLNTLDQHKPFTVVSITDETITVLPQSTGKERPISRDGVENAYRHLFATGHLTLAELESDFTPRNPVYVAAILTELPGVQHQANPIRLYLSKEA